MGNSNIVLCHAKKFSSQFIDSALYSDDIALAYVCVQAWHFAGFFLMPQRQIERVWLRSLYFQLFFLFWNDFSGFYAKMSSSFHSHINTDTHTHKNVIIVFIVIMLNSFYPLNEFSSIFIIFSFSDLLKI